MISVTTLVVVADAIARLFRRPFLTHLDRLLLFSATSAVGIVLYLADFGVLPVDIYRTGFSMFAPLVFAAAAAAVAARAPRAASVAIVVLAAFDVHLLRSRNLLDYALDPLLFIAAIVWCLVTGLRRWSDYHCASSEQHS